MPDWFKDMWNATPWGTNSHWKAIDAGGSTGGDGGGFVATNHWTGSYSSMNPVGTYNSIGGSGSLVGSYVNFSGGFHHAGGNVSYANGGFYYNWWTGGGSIPGGMDLGTWHRKFVSNSDFGTSKNQQGKWQDPEWARSFDKWMGEHFYAEASGALRHGTYADLMLKNGLGFSIGAYHEDSVTISGGVKTDKTTKYTAGIAYGVGIKWTYDVYSEANQISIGAATFTADITRNNIFVGWNPNLSVGLGLGGEGGFKIGLNFKTDNWFNYDNW
ncbi:hypothetical protein [Amniculibacterium sp. G2-70]|uniref:hypothetical protein n=1 Tax=Amniculibacterium sp. G2-70 TaxID=2767188 RepID=UPI0016542EE7|nr:hypothetical protein [Amniculibacterium sp. G2-70]